MLLFLMSSSPCPSNKIRYELVKSIRYLVILLDTILCCNLLAILIKKWWAMWMFLES